VEIINRVMILDLLCDSAVTGAIGVDTEEKVYALAKKRPDNGRLCGFIPVQRRDGCSTGLIRRTQREMAGPWLIAPGPNW
jgi:hypothetical protein